MATGIIMPKQGQSVESCILTAIEKSVGDVVSVGELLFAYETDKASFEEVAEVSGTVLALFFDEGDEVPVLTTVMVIGEEGESVDAFRPSEQPAAALSEEAPVAAPSGDPAAAPAVSSPSVVGVAYASGISSVSPRAQALAQQHAIDAASLVGSGPAGRVIVRDVEAEMQRRPRVSSLAKRVMAATGAVAPAQGSGLAGMVRRADLLDAAAAPAGGESTVVPLTNIRKLIARAMHASLQNSAQLTHHLSADARRLLSLRKEVKQAMREGSAADITINDMVCYAVVQALKKFPQVNAHFLGDSMRLFSAIHLGLAVDTERGLMVPAVKQVDQLSIQALSAQLKGVAEACKKGAIDPDLLAAESATFTVSNLGNYGVELFTPIINLPQVAILGVNTIVPRPKMLDDGVYAFVPHIGLSLTYDHRAIDGGEATRFLKQIAIEIEELHFDLK